MKQLEVYLDGEACGTLSQTPAGNLGFAYHEAYRTRPDATPLSLSMPLSASAYRKKQALPFFQGLLPDNPLALEAMARRYDVSARNPFALLEHVGSDVAGAIQVLPPGEASTDGRKKPDSERPVSTAEIVQMLETVIEEYQSGVSGTQHVGRFSLAGAQPKIALRRTNQNWSVPLEGAATTHILKPVSGDLPRIDVIEYITMRAAGLMGIRVARSTLETFGDVQVLVSTRYDRRQEGLHITRLHQEDLCQALSVSPEKKYQHREGGPGVGAIADLFRSLPEPEDQDAAAREFFAALAFNTLAGCTDAHAKNYSVLLQGRRVRLAPLYDLASIAGYWDGASRVNLAMSVGGTYALDAISLTDLAQEGARLGQPDAPDVVAGLRGQIVGAFESARDELVMLRPDAKKVAHQLVDMLTRLPLLAR